MNEIMRTIKLIQYLSVMSISLMLAACGTGKKCSEPEFVTKEYSDSISSEAPSYEYTFNASIELPECGMPENVMDNMRDNIVAAVLGENYVDKKNNRLLKDYSSDSFEEFLQDVEELTYDADFTLIYSTDIHGRVGYISVKDSLVGYERLINAYFGGAHGMQTVVNYIFDMKTGNILTEDDIFIDVDDPALTRLLVDKVNTLRNDTILPKQTDVFSDDLVVPNGNWGISDSGMYITYEPYEIAPYAFGIINVTLENEEIKHFIKPDSPLHGHINK